MFNSRRAAGMSLIEVVVFIVVLGIGFSGILVLYNQVTRASVDPLVRKQALAIGASLLEEIELQAFTYCDPDDPNVYTATGPSVAQGCGTVEIIGVEGGAETRYSNTLRFDNVSDYNGFAMVGNIRDITDTAIPGLDNYAVDVTVAEIAEDELPGFKTTPGPGESPVTEALRITVRVRVIGPAGIEVVLQGYRLRYAPNSP